MKLDQITAQVRLLGREQISTIEQLFSYKSKVDDEIKTLTVDRTHLRDEIRKVNIDDDLLSGKKQQISALSERRKGVRLCDDIAERSSVMRENLNAVLTDEEKPFIREKLERYKAQAKTEKEADHTDLERTEKNLSP